jgi:signal peptidase I
VSSEFEKRYRVVREVIETLVLTVLMFLIIRLAVQNFNVDGHSMEPNLHNQELILVDKWTYLFHPPARGDVVVFVAPPNPSLDYVKRVIGLPGDVITIKTTTVYVNGKALSEPYVLPSNQGNPFGSFKNRIIPPNTYFVLGDNRNGSSDSRDWGCVPRQNVIGRAALVYWPLGQDNDGLLPNEASVYQGIPAPPKTNSTDICPISPNDHLSTTTSPVHGTTNTNMVLLLIMPGMFVMFSRRKLVR